tara:strand:+ start:2043 stop:2309 length:267 start_codon:yes stop_codon:yes gene_type:complete
MNKPRKTYEDAYFHLMEVEEILDNVRTIIRIHAPENSVLDLIGRLNNLEDSIGMKLSAFEENKRVLAEGKRVLAEGKRVLAEGKRVLD